MGYCFVIGGGESLRGFDFSQLDGVTIGTNMSYRFHNSDYLYVQDKNFLKMNDLSDFKGKIITEEDLESQIKPNNSGFGALLFAKQLGCNPIYLLGFDMQCKNHTHFHDYYNHEISNRDSTAKKHLEHFRKHADEFKDVSVFVVADEGETALDCFPILSRDEVFGCQAKAI